MSRLIRSIIYARFLAMKTGQFASLVDSLEHSRWLNDAVGSGRVVRFHAPFSAEGYPGCLGRFSAGGFRFSRAAFAVGYRVEKDAQFKARQWYLLRHITARNRITAHLMTIIGKAQSDYIETGNPAYLRRLPYRRILHEYGRNFTDYLDPSIISRIVRGKKVQLPGGERIPLEFLFPQRSYLIGIKIRELIQRGPGVLSDRCLRRKLRDEYGMELSIRYVTYCRDRMAIPPASCRRQKKSRISICMRLRGSFALKRLRPCRANAACMN